MGYSLNIKTSFEHGCMCLRGHRAMAVYEHTKHLLDTNMGVLPGKGETYLIKVAEALIQDYTDAWVLADLLAQLSQLDHEREAGAYVEVAYRI